MCPSEVLHITAVPILYFREPPLSISYKELKNSFDLVKYCSNMYTKTDLEMDKSLGDKSAELSNLNRPSITPERSRISLGIRVLVLCVIKSFIIA